ncbi:non-ribosomal peptide synthetase component E (peptide arylation enzyme) [Spinactinospora alkalitolerans]|uniref:Non-ribosomal peptide synthetase component E (Peptide arylation enzyme) n=1 Tax=Spinactinospora alkalitolerans TaxID=687207 RepID=A0A852U3C0_9ACTN|nr:hypothetical protein [Spinactinospora alkalitolerans]NYE48450.1 non-ribosomal peptide synthetase component E (peptide arylation enzyme) [Spinactinospora alkalitolerans]
MRSFWESAVPSPETMRRYREQGWWRDTTYSDDLREAAAEDPDGTALLTWRQSQNRLIRLTFAEFDARADAVAAALGDLGVRRGDVDTGEKLATEFGSELRIHGLSLPCRPQGKPQHPR